MNLLGSLDGLFLEPLDFLERLVTSGERYTNVARRDLFSLGNLSLFFRSGWVARTFLIGHVCFSKFGIALA